MDSEMFLDQVERPVTSVAGVRSGPVPHLGLVYVSFDSLTGAASPDSTSESAANFVMTADICQDLVERLRDVLAVLRSSSSPQRDLWS